MTDCDVTSINNKLVMVRSPNVEVLLVVLVLVEVLVVVEVLTAVLIVEVVVAVVPSTTVKWIVRDSPDSPCAASALQPVAVRP